MENVCRSPMAEGALKQALVTHGLAGVVEVKSAGTLVTRPGCRPDVRAVRVAQSRGVDISKNRSEVIKLEDYNHYDYILAADKSVLLDLEKINQTHTGCKVMLLMSFVEDSDVSDIPDPYFGNNTGFERVMDLVELAAEGVVSTLLKNNLIKY